MGRSGYDVSNAAPGSAAGEAAARGQLRQTGVRTPRGPGAQSPATPSGRPVTPAPHHEESGEGDNETTPRASRQQAEKKPAQLPPVREVPRHRPMLDRHQPRSGQQSSARRAFESTPAGSEPAPLPQMPPYYGTSGYEDTINPSMLAMNVDTRSALASSNGGNFGQPTLGAAVSQTRRLFHSRSNLLKTNDDMC